MGKPLISGSLVLLLTITQLFLLAFPASAADELIFETFDNWKNPFVAEGWSTHSVGGWGGEYNQIYDAAQRITSLQGDSAQYRSVYKDFKATPGKYYSVSFEPVEGAWLNYYPGQGSNLVWLQFDDQAGNVLSTHGGKAGIEHHGDQTYYEPGLWTNWGIRQEWKRQGALAPAGTDHVRVVFQVLANSGSAAFRKATIYEASPLQGAQDAFGMPFTIFSFVPISGPRISRNTEFGSGRIAEGWGSHTAGRFPGEYGIKPAGGSSQGISAGGTFASFRSVYRDLKVTPGQKCKLSVDVISNSTNETGTTTPSPVRVWIQYDDAVGNVLSTHGISGDQAGIKSEAWTTMIIPGPMGEQTTVAPIGADHARVILQVMGGTGGGTIFDNVSFSRVE